MRLVIIHGSKKLAIHSTVYMYVRITPNQLMYLIKAINNTAWSLINQDKYITHVS